MIFSIWLLGVRINAHELIANLFWPFGFLLWGVLLCLFVRWYKWRVIVQPKQEPHIEPLPALPRYVQEVCEILRELEERARQTDNL